MKEELIDVVDENDIIIDVKPKSEVRDKILTHRGVKIIIMNTNKEIFVHQRSYKKKSHAGKWDIFFGGFVSHDEDYEQSALRELKEEAGINANELEFVTDFRFTVKDDDWFGKLYKFVHDGEIKLQEEEIETGKFISLAEVDDFVKEHEIKPSSEFVYKNFQNIIK